MSLPTALDHCVIHVSDWETARDFYTRIIGAEAIPQDVGFAFRFGEQQLNCHGPDKKAAPKARLPVMPGNSDLCFRWEGPIAGALGATWSARASQSSSVRYNGLAQRGRGPASISAIRMGRCWSS